jgi:hypothetical protein
MVRPFTTQSDEWGLPLIWVLGSIAALSGCFWFLVVYLSQPTVYRNPGLAAYTPPPGTRLLPLPRKMDAPEVADLDESPPSPVTALAQAQTNEKQVKSSRVLVRKRAHEIPREPGLRARGYAQQWNGFGDWNSTRSWSSGRKFTGDPRPWF